MRKLGVCAGLVLLLAMDYWGLTTYNKGSSTWGEVTIWLFLPLLFVPLVAFCYYHKLLGTDEETPESVYYILIFGALACMIAGIVFTEPTRSVPSGTDPYRYSRSGGYYYYFFGSSSSSTTSSSPSITMPKTSSKGGELYLLLVVVAAILSAAIVPHIWALWIVSFTLLYALFVMKEFTRYTY